MNNLRRLGNQISVDIKPDEDGFTGRECPEKSCGRYFKIEFGTGLEGEGLPCHCPYCGHAAPHDHFWTKEQIRYAESVVTRQVTNAVYNDLKALEFNHRPRGSYGIGLSLKIKRGRPIHIQGYQEKMLETEVVCDQCTLRYAIYGVFASCPDCGVHNSLQILTKNLDVVLKLLDLAGTLESDVATSLIEDAMENVVSAFDGFGRETCRVFAHKSNTPDKAANISFQNLNRVRDRLYGLFHIDLNTAVSEDEWKFACRCFMKRHILAHKMGVIDEQYVNECEDIDTVVGRRVTVLPDEVRRFAQITKHLGQFLMNQLLD